MSRSGRDQCRRFAANSPANAAKIGRRLDAPERMARYPAAACKFPADAGGAGERRYPLPALDSGAAARVTAAIQHLRRSRPMLDAYLYAGRRSPFGRHAGALARLRPDDMLAGVIARVVADSGFAPEKIEDVVVGCANQAGEDSRCVARHAALVAGLPIEIPGSVLQRNCGSGLNAIPMAAQAVTRAGGEGVSAGAAPSMGRGPLVVGKAESAV